MIFLDYGFSKTQSKKLSSVQKRKIPNAFTGTLHNNFKYLYEAFALPADKSNVYFFLLATLDRSEEINRYFNSVKLSPIDVEEDLFLIVKLFLIPLNSILTILREKCFLKQLFKR